MKPYLNYFKTTKAYDRYDHLHYLAQEIAIEFIRYAIEIGVADPIITETVTTKEEDAKVNRQHDQHRRCVAFDGRVSDWSGEQRDAMIKHLNETFKEYAYVTESGEKIIAFCHDNGNGEHFHVAINARYKLPEFIDANNADV